MLIFYTPQFSRRIFFVLLFGFVVVFSLSADTLKDAKKAYSQRQFQKAVKLFTEHTKTHPSSGEPYMYMGYIYETNKQYDTSIAYFRKAVDLNLNSKQKKNCLIKILIYYNYHGAWDMVVHYANRYLKMESNKEVAKMRDRAVANRGSDSGRVSNSVSSNQNVNSHTNNNSNNTGKDVAKDSSKSKKNEVKKKSEKTPEKSVVVETPAPISKKEETIEKSLWAETLAFLQKEDFIRADKNLKKLLILDKDNTNYNYKAGIVKLRLGEFEEALEFFRIARKNALPKDNTIHYYISLNEGQVYQKMGKFKEAEESYTQAFNYMNHSAPLLALTKLKFEEGVLNEALNYSENLLRAENNNAEGWMYRGIAKVKLGNRSQGFKDLMQFSLFLRKNYPELKQVPAKFQDGVLYLGVFYSNRSKYKLALKYLKAVQGSRMDSNAYSFSLGKTYFYTGKYDLAMLQLERTKNVPAAHYLIGKIYAIQKNISKAREHLGLAASKKEVYWIKARLDVNYRELMTDPSFSEFVLNKGEIPPEKTVPITNITPEQPKEESKPNPLNESKIEN